MAPHTNNGQPSDASNGQPATNTGQPAANTGQPSVTSAGQPSATNAEQPSVTNNEQPAIANNGQPATNTGQPAVIVNGLPPHRQRNQQRQRQRQQQRQLQPSPQLTYPVNKSPIIPGSAQLDADWITASRAYDVFNMALPAVNTPGYMETWSAKCNHMQANFWAALDRANRASRPPRGDPEARRCWHYHDMRAMVTWFRRCFGKPQPEEDAAAHADGIWRDVLLSSPWFDCPDFMDLLWEVARDRNGNMVLNHLGQGMVVERDPRKAELEEQFLDRWWFRVARLPVRRWPTGDVVMPLNAGDFFRIYGPWASLWPHVRDPDLLYID
ncbi:hypothetical protein BKA56DRAFT_611780 [Ilyonectria sp. MPI-CAGE-AT-0026]|nr:hypothetical protein BKA56DRAFT_611780 [Ilyonectria sp. MPI-CAGE-AT-0026]